MKKTILAVLFVFLCATMVFSAGKSEKQQVESGPTKVSFWYLWGGKEGEYVEEMIKKFNSSQSDYIVEGLSVPDVQKILVAISSGEGPDITDNFSTNVAGYASKGILEPLDDYISSDKYDTSDFTKAAMESVSYNGKVYALPISVNLMMLFYNKDLLAKAGYTEPPKTDKELLEYSIKLTETESNGDIKVLGFPDFPSVYYPMNMSYALGGDFQDASGALTPDNSGSRAALDLIVKYRKKFGVDKVQAINSSGGYLSAADPFVSGRQALRIDGPWFGNTVKNTLKVNLNYGVAPLPYPEGHPEMAYGGVVNTSIFFITSNSKNKEGAWKFLSWLHEKSQMVSLSSKMGWIPTRISALSDPAFSSAYDFKAFSELAKSKNLKNFPAFASQGEYSKIISDAFEKAELLKMTPEEALSEAQDKAKSLEK